MLGLFKKGIREGGAPVRRGSAGASPSHITYILMGRYKVILHNPGMRQNAGARMPVGRSY